MQVLLPFPAQLPERPGELAHRLTRNWGYNCDETIDLFNIKVFELYGSQHVAHVRPCNPRLSWILDSPLWIPNSLSVELESRFQSFAGFQISLAEFRFQRPRFRIPQAKPSGISDFTARFACIPESGHGSG